MPSEFERRVLEVYRMGGGFWSRSAFRAVLECRHVVDLQDTQRAIVGAWLVCPWCEAAARKFLDHVRAPGHSKLRMAKAGLHTERHYVTIDHPAAGGRVPLDGETGVRFFFPIDDGSRLYLEMGSDGFANLLNVILAYMLDVQTNIPDRQEDRER